MINRILELFWAFIKIYCVLFVIGDGVTLLTYTLFLNKRKIDALKLTCVIDVFNEQVWLLTHQLLGFQFILDINTFFPNSWQNSEFVLVMRQLELKSEKIHEALYGLHF